LPDDSVSVSGPATFCAGDSVILTAVAGGPGFTYSWSNGETTQSITVDTTGNYSVTITDANGCSVTSAPVAVVVNYFPEDVNRDGIVSGNDLSLVLIKFGTPCPGCPEDITGDGLVSGADLSRVLIKWGQRCSIPEP
jgi:hypothetical protein